MCGWGSTSQPHLFGRFTLKTLSSHSKNAYRALVCFITFLAWLAPIRTNATPILRVKSPVPPVYVHYMAWFQAKPAAHVWGWHWTMGRYNPSVTVHGLPQIASHYHPQVGPYDSGDPDLLKYQIMLMKMTGIKGVIIDWYGCDKLFDFTAINRNVERMVPLLTKAGLKFALCYEDHTVPQAIKAGLFRTGAAVQHGQALMLWLQKHYFQSPAYIRIGGKPLLLSFGAPYYDDLQWNQIFSVLKTRPLYLTESNRREPTASLGAFDWPLPANGTAAGLAQQRTFLASAKAWPYSLAAAFPGFNDIYAQAGVGKSWGHIAEANGHTLESTLKNALHSSVTAIQVVTWNDWGEGTQIEPSIEQGTRDLRIIRTELRKSDPSLRRWDSRDLQLPAKWYALRKHLIGSKSAYRTLDTIYRLTIMGHMTTARSLLNRLWRDDMAPGHQ